MRLIPIAIAAGLLCAPAAMAEDLTLTVAEADTMVDANGLGTILFTLDPSSARRFGEFTARRIDQQIFIYVDGTLIVAPVIKTAIPGGTGLLPTGGDATETARLIAYLQAGGDIVVSDEAR